MRIVIIGGGVIGLSIGWRLAGSGHSVALFERKTAGHAASWAAAGMLAAGLEAEAGEQALLRLNLESQRRWPAFRDELEAASGMSIGYRSEGTLQVALTRDDAEHLRFRYELHKKFKLDVRWLKAVAAREAEPHLRPGISAALHSPHDHQVDNRYLGQALKAAFIRKGGVLHEQTPVQALDTANRRVTGIVAKDQVHPAEVVVLAAGAWSREILNLPDHAAPPVRPVKGQMLALRMTPQAPLLRHVLRAPKIYLVPRLDGRLILGATVEEAGFDDRLTAGALLGLLDAAWRVLPALEDLPVDEMWSGFRPGSPDDGPILGPSGLDGLILATGHHRNGILLTPLTAEVIARLITEGCLPEIAADFTLGRFSNKEIENEIA